MFVRKTLVALASLAVAGAAMLFMASLAHADQTATIDCTRGGNTDRTLDGAGPWTFVLGDCGRFPVVSVSRTADDIRGPADGAQVTVFNDPAGNGDYTGNYTGDANVFGGGDKFSPTINHGVRIAYERDGGPEVGTIIVDFKDEVDADFKQTFEITLGDGGGGDDGGDGGGDQSSGSSGSAGSTSSSPSISLQVLDEADGSWARALEAGLVAWEKSVPVNTWQPLPNSADVVGTGEDEGKVFLGVATTPDFPVDIAQRQVDNGWGAYDMHDDQGNLESVFIPAGGSMFVWTQPRLYAVWGAPAS